MTITIGLTGSIATGKSTIAKMFSSYLIPVIDADKISREVVEPGQQAYQDIVDTFGEEILTPDKTLDRKKLGKIIFNDETSRKKLNQIVHPAVRKSMLFQKNQFIEQGEDAIVLDIPLLFESNLTNLVDKVLVVYVDERTQLKRLMKRDQSTESEAKSRIQSQMSIKEKAEMADAVINNNGSIGQAEEQLKRILNRWNIRKFTI